MNDENYGPNGVPQRAVAAATDPCEFAGQSPLEWPVPRSGSRPNLDGVRKSPVTFWSTEEEPGRYTSFETRSSLEKGISYHLVQAADEIGDLRWRLVGQEWGQEQCVLTDHPVLKFCTLPELLAAMGVLAREDLDLSIWGSSSRKEIGYARSRWKSWLQAVPSWVMCFEE